MSAADPEPRAADAEAFRLGMRRLAAGVCLVAANHKGEPHGLLATSVTALSGAPPSLLVCINRAAHGHDPLLRSGVFSVNVLAQDHRGLAASFANSGGRSTRFQVGGWAETAAGAPFLADAMAVFECRVDRAVAYGTHTIVIGLIDKVRLGAADREPLLYFNGAFAALTGAA